jgi:hypothetical protein
LVPAPAVALVNEDGFWDHFVAVTSEARVSQLVVEVLTGTDGEVIPPPPDPLPEWLAIASNNPRLMAVAGQFGAVEDWTDLYKVYELLGAALGRQPGVEKGVAGSGRTSPPVAAHAQPEKIGELEEQSGGGAAAPSSQPSLRFRHRQRERKPRRAAIVVIARTG